MDTARVGFVPGGSCLPHAEERARGATTLGNEWFAPQENHTGADSLVWARIRGTAAWPASIRQPTHQGVRFMSIRTRINSRFEHHDLGPDSPQTQGLRVCPVLRDTGNQPAVDRWCELRLRGFLPVSCQITNPAAPHSPCRDGQDPQPRVRSCLRNRSRACRHRLGRQREHNE
jgi:hypothetical protein